MTLRILRRTVPAAVPSINFLSGGQSPEEASANLNALSQLKGNAPWNLSFSYGRALQETAMKAWSGDPQNREQAQREFSKRARLNSLAQRGAYSADQE
jgi:fructose-bisphosphate aldolase class I